MNKKERKNGKKTLLLPPISAVRIVWALTGIFPKDEHSHRYAIWTLEALKSIKDQAEKEKDQTEYKYISSAIALMEASLRSLDTVYKGRELNFEDNEKLRSVYLDSVKDSLDFGNKAKDVLKALPTMTIGGAGGATVARYFGISDTELWGIGLILAAAGYFIHLQSVRISRKRKEVHYVMQDYERSLYYNQYVTQVATILLSLYLDINRIHKNFFGQKYPMGAEADEIIDDFLKGIRPTYCKYVHKHMKEKKITIDLWSLCESGVKNVVNCDYWGG